MQHVQPPAYAFQGLAEFRDAVPDEGDSAVRARPERPENVGVEHEDAVNLSVPAQRGRQRGMVVVAQISSNQTRAALKPATPCQSFV